MQGEGMYLLGDKKTFAVEISKNDIAYQMSVYVEGKDILQFKLNGINYMYRWRDCNDIIEWIQENLENILSNDDFPLSVLGDSAAELCEISYKLDIDDVEQYEILQDWVFKHSWLSAREGSYLADIYFRKVGNKIEISWDNSNTFKEDGIIFIFPKGRYEVDIIQFKEIMENLCLVYNQL